MNLLRELLTPENDAKADAYRQLTLIAVILLALILAAGITYTALA